MLKPRLCIGLLVSLGRQLCTTDDAETKPVDTATSVEDSAFGKEDKVLAFHDERRLWLLALVRIFDERADLKIFGPLIWHFLDDHPRAVRIACNGSLIEVDISGRSRQNTLQQFSGEPMQFLSHRILVCAEENALAFHEEDGVRKLISEHVSEIRCLAACENVFAIGGADTRVELWRDGSEGEPLKFVSQEWSDWTGTTYLGHTAPVTAICLMQGWPVSADAFGSVCFWRSGGNCDMLQHAP